MDNFFLQLIANKERFYELMNSIKSLSTSIRHQNNKIDMGKLNEYIDECNSLTTTYPYTEDDIKTLQLRTINDSIVLWTLLVNTGSDSKYPTLNDIGFKDDEFDSSYHHWFRNMSKFLSDEDIADDESKYNKIRSQKGTKVLNRLKVIQE